MDYIYLRMLVHGWLLHFAARDDAARAAYADAFARNPQSARAARALGFIDARKKRYHDATHWYREAVRIEPGDAANWFNLGHTLAEDGARPAASEAFRKAVTIEPTMGRAWYGLGIALAHGGDHAGAVLALERVAELQPMNAVAWYHLGLAYRDCCRPDKVEEAIRHIAEFDPWTCHRLIVETDRNDLESLVHGRLS